MKSCPTCGHPLPSDLLRNVSLSPLQARIFLAVTRRSPHGVSQNELADIVYADRRDGGPDNARVTIRTSIHQLNKKLRQHDPPLRIIGHGNDGYHLIKLFGEFGQFEFNFLGNSAKAG